jgi:hypothetical protein
MNSVIYTDFMQSIVLVGGALLATLYCAANVSGGVFQSSLVRWGGVFMTLLCNLHVFRAKTREILN